MKGFEIPKLQSKPIVNENLLLSEGLSKIFSLFDSRMIKRWEELGQEPSEQEQLDMIKHILWEYCGAEIDWKADKETNNKMLAWLKKKNLIFPIAVVLGFATLKGVDKLNKKDSEGGSDNEIVAKDTTNKVEDKDTLTYPVREPEIPTKKFEQSVYEILPLAGKEVYKYQTEKNPTPGKGYIILDKDNAVEYIFDGENNLVAKVTSGFGEDPGDENNTSFSQGTGKKTTPAGAYLISMAYSKKDSVIYGKYRFSLFGKSIRGEKVFLGHHQTYPGELEQRTVRLETSDPRDNNFSNGCINIDVKDFEKYVSPYFKGDNTEILYVLPDSLSRSSGVTFNPDLLTKDVARMIIELSSKQEAQKLEELLKEKDSLKITQINKEINRLREKRARAMTLLEGK